jgi:hypothetical protein
MKLTKLSLCSAFLLIVAAGVYWRTNAADASTSALPQYATIRWAGKENTHIIRPGGEVEFIGAQLRQMRKPERADERSFYMNVALNGMIKEGYELAAFTADEIVMKRTSRP